MLSFFGGDALPSVSSEAPCADSTACNYGQEGTCEYTSCAGCTKPLACNYDASATIQEDGSCVFVGSSPCNVCSWQLAGQPNPADGSGTLVDNDVDGDGLCDDTDLCKDTDACNYDVGSNPNATCIEKILYFHDADGDGVPDYELGYYCEGEQPGNSTTTQPVEGVFDLCTNELRCNYDGQLHTNAACETDEDGDGLCDGSDLCTDGQAPNFDHAEYGNEPCCTDANNNSVCDTEEVFGCTDSQACNYLVHANLDDGSCKYHTANTDQSSNATSQYAVNNEDSLCDACEADGATVTIPQSAADSLGLASNVISIGKYISNDADGDDVCDSGEQVGCDDPNACNYKLDASGSEYGQAVDAFGNAMTDAAGDPVYITESCYFDDDLGYGVTPNEETCTNYCRYNDACGNCGGSEVDVDGDGVCDNTDLCTNTLACNYASDPTEACKFLTECGICGAGTEAGTDADNDGIIDGDDSDSDNDGLCDATDDACYDLTACNYDDDANEACAYLDACGECGGDGTDVDGDGLCDDIDLCTDTSKCNYDINEYPNNLACLEDTDGDLVCDPFEIYGCLDAEACNYNDGATEADASQCLYATGTCETCSGDLHDGSDFIVVSDSDGDGICDATDLCSDASACNFDDPANGPCGVDADGNGTCDDAEVLGCKNSRACNYDASATRDDGSCAFPTACQICSGATDGTGIVQENDSDFDGVCNDDDNCSDTNACNYIAASSANATCIYATAGQTCQGDCISDIDNDGICEHEGSDLCFDLRACNYNDPANTACIYRDSCGRCGPSTPGQPGYDPAVYCDCELNVVDSLGNCGGMCFADVDNDGVCDNVDPCLVPGEELDACGVCGGPGAIYDCGCFDLPDGACSCEPDGTVTYPAQGKDCDGNCIYGTVVVDGVTMCAFYDNAETTALPTPVRRTPGVNGKDLVRTDSKKLEEWIIKMDTLHSRMSRNLDDGSLTGASERLTIEDQILDKGELNVLGNTRMSGLVQMDSNVVILGNLVVEKNATIKGTTFSKGGIETSSMNMSGDLSVGGATVIDSTLEVLQSTLLHDSLTALGAFTIGRDRVFAVDTLGNTSINGQVDILDSLVATSSGTRLAGLTADATTLSSLTTTGDATVRKDLEVRGNSVLKGTVDVDNWMKVDGTLNVTGTSTFPAVHSTSIVNSGMLTTDSIFNSNKLQTGDLVVQNGSTTKTLNVLASSDFKGPVNVVNSSDSLIFGIAPSASGSKGTASVAGNIRMYPSSQAYIDNHPSISLLSSGSVFAAGLVSGSHLQATSPSAINTFNGSLLVKKSATLNEGLLVKSQGENAFQVGSDGTINFYKPTSVNGNMSLTGDLTMQSGANLTVAGNTSVQGLTVTGTASLSTFSATTGTFTGNLAAGGVLRMGSGLYVGSQTASVPSGYIAMFDGGPSGLNKSNGLAIRINHSGDKPGGDNHYLVFKDKSGSVIGEIRGEDSGNWRDDAFKALDRDEHAAAVGFAATNLAYRTVDAVSQSSLAASSIVQVACKFIPDSWMVFWPGIDWGDVPSGSWRAAVKTKQASDAIGTAVWAGVKLVEATTYLALWDAANSGDWANGGVSYASGNGDYAEWIERANPKEDYHARQIVGVKNGKISLQTSDADHLMVISTAPIVLGNQPADSEIDAYEKVAFMGQVPVTVIGKVKAGDFIVPSGDGDGFGLAVHPEDLQAHEVNQIVGVAWQDGTERYFNTVNVAVGLDHSATALRFVQLQDRMEDLRAELDEITAMVYSGGALATSQPVAAPQEKTFFRRIFKGGDEVKGETDLAYEERPSQADGKPNKPGKPTSEAMLAGMSESDILQAVEDTRNGEIPPQWMENVNGKELTTIIQTVFDHHVQQAEQESLAEVERIKEQSFTQYVSNIELMTHNVESLEDLQDDIHETLAGLGIDQDYVEEMHSQVVAKILVSEFSMENITEIIRKGMRSAPREAMAFSHIKPGTQAERQFVEQVQNEVFKAIATNVPEVASHMEVESRPTSSASVGRTSTGGRGASSPSRIGQ